MSEGTWTTVFVYGTLKRGHRNHSLLGDSRFLGDATVEGYTLLDVSSGAFPGAVESSSGKVLGELYAADAATLTLLDDLEGVGRNEHMYRREVVQSSNGECSMYVWNRGRNYPEIGDSFPPDARNRAND